MSKSVGNVVDPEEVIFGGKDKKKNPSYGVDVLRWWVAHSHHHLHIMVGSTLLEKFQEDVFKVRKCMRHLLGNLFDFDPAKDMVEYNKMNPIDQYFLYVLYTTITQMEEAYESFSYHKVIQLLEKFFYSDLSSFYINITHDRCYCNAAVDHSRRSCQTVQYHVVNLITAGFAPIIPHLAEEIFRHLPKSHSDTDSTDSIFKLGWCKPLLAWNNVKAFNKLLPVFDMRRVVMDKFALESPVEFDIHIYSSPRLHDLLRELQPELTSSTSSLCELFQTSQVSVLDSPPIIIPEDSFILEGRTHLLTESSSVEVDYKILVTSAQLHMCERCRRYTAKSTTMTCDRCLNAMANDWAT